MGRFLRAVVLVGAGTAAATAMSQVLTGSDVRRTYESLAKPPWAPPPQVFAPVWFSLYGLLIVATARVVSQDDDRAKKGQLALYATQMVANAVWTPLFFRFRWYKAAEIDAALLTVLVGALSASYASRSRSAAAMLAPVIAWCAFATVLTHEIRIRNERSF